MIKVAHGTLKNRLNSKLSKGLLEQKSQSKSLNQILEHHHFGEKI